MRRLLVALGATFVVLLGTGLYQAWRYVPTAGRAWPGAPNEIDRGFLYDTTDLVHRVGAWVFVALVVAVIVVWILRARGTGRSTFIGVVVLIVLALASIAAMITGNGLRWDQLALSAVRVDSAIRGVFLPDSAKYVLIGGTELAPSEFSSRVFLHLVVFPVGLVLCAGVLWFLSVHDDRRRAALASEPAAPGEHDDAVAVGQTAEA